MLRHLNTVQNMLDKTRMVEAIAPLLLRIFLFFPLWEAGMNKLNGFEGTVEWFGNAVWGLGLPFPAVMASLAIAAELGGSLALLFGVATRWAAIPLMVTMLVAIFSVHWSNGWLAISASNSYWFGQMEGAQALAEFKQWARNIPEYQAVTRYGPIVVLNNGIEFAATYFLMLLVLFFQGAGALSVDRLIATKFRHKVAF